MPHTEVQPKHYQVSTTFDIDANKSVETLGCIPSDDPNIPSISVGYKFRRQFLRELFGFLEFPDGDGLYITGPTGSGKTTGVTQVLGRLNWPCQQVTAHGRMELADLIGQFKLVTRVPGQAPEMEFCYGVLPTAMKYGHVLLINEIDYADPSVNGGLNDVIEGRPLVITETGGEVIVPHPMFRVIVTGNSAGAGDETGLHQGVQIQNLAFMDRFRLSVVDYMSPQDELDVLCSVVDMPKKLLESMIDVANSIRDQFKASVNGQHTEQLNLTMSTRTLVRWASLADAFSAVDNPLKYSLDIALTNRADASQKLAIEKIAHSILGEAWDRDKQKKAA